MEPKERESEVKEIHSRKGAKGGAPRRDPSMEAGERVESPEEKAARRREKQKPTEAPIIQKDVT